MTIRMESADSFKLRLSVDKNRGLAVVSTDKSTLSLIFQDMSASRIILLRISPMLASLNVHAVHSDLQDVPRAVYSHNFSSCVHSARDTGSCMRRVRAVSKVYAWG